MVQPIRSPENPGTTVVSIVHLTPWPENPWYRTQVWDNDNDKLIIITHHPKSQYILREYQKANFHALPVNVYFPPQYILSTWGQPIHSVMWHCTTASCFYYPLKSYSFILLKIKGDIHVPFWTPLTMTTVADSLPCGNAIVVMIRIRICLPISHFGNKSATVRSRDITVIFV